MKLIFRGLSLFGLAIGFASCQQEVDDIFNTPPLSPADSVYVSRFIELDTTYPAGLDTFFKRNYSYDANRRIKEITGIEFLDASHDSDYTLREYRFYNGIDTVPYKVVRHEWFLGPETYRDTIYLTYNSSNIIVKDSTVHYKDGSLISFIVNRFSQIGATGILVKRTTDGGVGLFSSDSILSQRVYSGGNIITATDSVYSSTPPGLYSSSFYNFTYDTKVNPFRRVLLQYPLSYYDPYNIIQPFYYPFQQTVNNPLTHTQSHFIAGGNVTINGTCQYVYNSKGYPVIIRYSSTALSNPHKGVVYYTAL